MSAPELGATVTNSKVLVLMHRTVQVPSNVWVFGEPCGLVAKRITNVVMEYPRSRSKYMPHQGIRERVRQLKRKRTHVVDIELHSSTPDQGD